MEIRQINGDDFYAISPLVNEWWGGRNMVDMLPKLFFDHFTSTSFVVVKEGEIIGFLIGFYSQTFEKVAYIHFVGVHPHYRNQKIGRSLYERFINVVKKSGREFVKCITSPINKNSIKFHTKMDFSIEKGDRTVDGVSFFTNYDGENQDRVLFVKRI